MEKKVQVHDEIEMLEDGGMFKKGERYYVNGVEEKFFYYSGNLALSIDDPRYKVISRAYGEYSDISEFL